MAACPICKNVASQLPASGDYETYQCPRCGTFQITRSALAMLPERLASSPNAAARLSHAVHTSTSASSPLMINSINLDELVSQSLPPIDHQIRNLLRWIKDEIDDDALGSPEIPHNDHLAGIIGTLDASRVDDLINLAARDGLIELVPIDCVRITTSGWEYLRSDAPQTPHFRIEQPFSTEERPPMVVETTKSHCNNCRGTKKHFLRATHTVADNDGIVQWSDTYDVLECCGCSEISVRHERWFSEHDWIDEDDYGNPRLNRGIKTTYWPPASRRHLPDWADKIEDEVMRGLMDELYGALNADLIVIATIGARTLFERASIIKVGDPAGGFAKKLQLMVERGQISQEERSTLEAMTDAGNASAHRAYRPTINQISSIVSILENFIERSFILPKLADDLKSSTPSRKAPA